MDRDLQLANCIVTCNYWLCVCMELWAYLKSGRRGLKTPGLCNHPGLSLHGEEEAATWRRMQSLQRPRFRLLTTAIYGPPLLATVQIEHFAFTGCSGTVVPSRMHMTFSEQAIYL